VFKAPCMFNEYYKNPTVTARDLINGWFHTGDLGYVSHNHLFVTGRKKDLIILAGKNIYPQDIESMVNETEGVIPGRCVAIGVENEEKGTEELVVIAETNVVDPHELNKMKEKLYERIAGQTEVVPAEIRFVPHKWLHKSSSGKIARKANRLRYNQLPPEKSVLSENVKPTSASPPLEPEKNVDEEVLSIIKLILSNKRLSFTELKHDTALLTSGLIDSLTLAEVIAALEYKLSIEFPPSMLNVNYLNTPRQIADVIQKLMKHPELFRALRSTVSTHYTNERDGKCEYFLARQDGINLLILGSSKAVRLTTDIASKYGYTGFNFAVNSARAEDWYAILKFVLQHNKASLRKVILGVDIESFSNGVVMDRRLRDSKYLVKYLNPEDLTTSKIANKHTPPMELNDKSLADIILENLKIGDVRDEIYNPETGDHITSRIDSPGNDRSPVVLKNPLERSSAEYLMRMRNFTEISSVRMEYFIQFVELCAENGIQLLIYLSPLHKKLHQQIVENTEYGSRLKDFKRLMDSTSLPFLKFFYTPTVDTFGGLEDDFLNGAHMGRANADILLEKLLQENTD
ncbi:AMP-binding protein, partial [bacterium]|nr:AMP-binding protein [bacterium]